jgi:hypothetical protein
MTEQADGLGNQVMLAALATQAAAEARAALLEQVLRVVDEAFDAEELRMPLESVGGALKALYHVRARIEALNETNEVKQ